MAMNIETKSTAALIDELITTSMKCWHAQDRIMDVELSQEQRLAAAEMAQKTNARRCELMVAIDGRMGERSVLAKTYA
jgi:hypothetical protein